MKPHIRAATWNLNNAISDDGSVFDLREQVDAQKAIDGVDLLAAQEVPFIDGGISPDFASLLERCGFEYSAQYILSSAYNRGSPVESGLLIASRHPLEGVTRHPFENPELVAQVSNSVWESDDKGYIAASTTIDGKSISFTCTHLLPFIEFGVAIDSPAAAVSWRQLEQHASEVVKDAKFAIIAGDFNRSVQRLGTLNSAAFGLETRDTRDSVDAIFISSDVVVGSVRTVPNSSDHHLLIGDFGCSS
jgi:endonuclease/exonuclease/phosphatase family metal-dependent hydrolase